MRPRAEGLHPRADGLDPRAEGLGPWIEGLDPRILDSGRWKTELFPKMNLQFRNKLDLSIDTRGLIRRVSGFCGCYAVRPVYALHLPQDLHRGGSSGGRGGERRDR